jgi:CheY-like chemotaxis protein
MEAIGSLAGGIAHDFNNILVPIIGHAEIAQLETPEENQIHRSLREILRAATRAKDLVGQILAFSRQSEIEFRPLKIHIVVREAIRLLRASIPPSVEIVQKIAKDCGPVMGDPSQIHQVVMNLATNAYHAMAETGGTMTVSLSEVGIDAKNPKGPHPMPMGRYACLSVEDTGSGIDKAMIGKIFDPYFTTKPQGEGTGLGLSVVHGIVTSHKGKIFVNSQPGEGSCFTIYLPLVQPPLSRVRKSTPPKITGGTEHIVVVDDEEAITGMFKNMLSRLGYAVTVCNSGHEMLRQIEAEPERFDLVITDYAMPQMNGIELAEALHRIRPRLPILLCTGVSENLSLEDFTPFGIVDILLKPVFSNELDAKIRNILASKTSAVDPGSDAANPEQPG